MPRLIRVGAVSYLNAKPLYYRLEERSAAVELSMDLPSRLASRLASGDLDVALIPSVEYLRGAASGYEILPGFAIAARGAVRSVKLFSRVPFDRIDRLALDEGSRTSQALTRVWLDARHGVRPSRIEALPMGVSALESTADAVLVIGDRAMKVPDAPFHAVVDLAEAWNDADRPAVRLRPLGRPARVGPRRPARDPRPVPRPTAWPTPADLAATYGPRLGLDLDVCFEYLTRVLSYDLGEPEVAGLRRFARMAAELGLAPEGVDLVFHRRRDLATSR